MKEQKQTNGKPKFWNRVDIGAMIRPVAELRDVAITKIGKYPENMDWGKIGPEYFIDAMQRHLNEINSSGNPWEVDKETGLPHLFAIGFNYMVLCIKYYGRERKMLKK